MSIYGYLKRITNTALAILFAAGTLFCAAACQTDPPSLATVASNTSLTVTPSKTTTTATNSTTTAPASKTTRQTTATTRVLEVLKHGDTVWKEVSIVDKGAYIILDSFSTFGVKENMANTDFVFRGKVIDCREYEISWTDQKGESWGPYSGSIIEVQLARVYYGRSPVSSGTIKIYYPYAISDKFDRTSAIIREQQEYVFLSRAYDNEYLERVKTSEDKSSPEVYTDAYVPGPFYYVFPVENGDVYAHYEYFSWNDALMKKAKPDRQTDLLSSGISKGGFVVMAEKDFEEALLWLFHHPDTLPTGRSFFEPPETTRSTDVSQKKIKEDYVAFLKRRYSNSSEYQNLQTSKVFIRRVVGTYGDVTVLFIDKGGMFYTQAVSYAAVDGITFRFPDSQQLLVYKEGDFDTLNGAFERGWIDRQDLIVIHRDLYVGVGMEEPDLTMPIPERFTTTATTPATTTTAP